MLKREEGVLVFQRYILKYLQMKLYNVFPNNIRQGEVDDGIDETRLAMS